MELQELFSRRSGFEKSIKQQIDERVKSILPDDMMLVKVEVPLKVFYDKPQDVLLRNVELGKLGEAEPIGGNLQPRKRIAMTAFYDNIKEVNVEVFLDHSIERYFEAEIANIVHALLRDVPKAKIKLNFSRILFKQRYLNEEVAQLQHGAKQNAPWLIGIGVFLLMSIILIGLIGWLKGGVKAFHHLADKALDVMQEKAKHPLVPEKIVITTGAPTAYADNEGVSQLKKVVGLKDEIIEAKSELAHLMTIASGRRMRLVHLVREWVYKNSPDAQAALMLLPELLGTEVFANTIALLSDEERGLWSTQLARSLQSNDILLGKSFIKSHCHELLMDVEASCNSQIHELGITTEEYVEIIYKDTALGAQIIKGLPEGQVKMIMKKLPKGYVTKVIESSMDVDGYRMEDAISKVKGLLSELREDRFRALPPTYVDYIVQQLKDVGPRREKEILNMFRQSGRMEVLQNVTKEVFPSELILQMPTQFLASVMREFDLMKRAELLYLARQEEINQLLLSTGEKDSPERMSVDVEIEKIDNDIRALKRVRDNAEKTWSEFYQRARTYISSDPELKRQANFLLDRWHFQAASKEHKFSKAS